MKLRLECEEDVRNRLKERNFKTATFEGVVLLMTDLLFEERKIHRQQTCRHVGMRVRTKDDKVICAWCDKQLG